MKKIFLLAVFAAGAANINAQQAVPIHFNGQPACGFDKVLHRTKTDYSTLVGAYRNNSSQGKTTGVIYDIPVVFHVVYGAPSLNLPDSILHNQIAILNKAYRKQHADTANPRSIFRPLSEDALIQFHLATTNPLGAPTTGITRTLSPILNFGGSDGSLDSMERLKSSATGGIDPWPTDKYLNIWIGNLTDTAGNIGVLGYGIPPLNPLPGNWPAGTEIGLAGLKDGVVLQTHCIGDNNPLSAALQGLYTKGRAAVHEVGHYLGLQHVFGGNGGGPADCGAVADDGMNDTPTQSTISFTNGGCPSATKNSCGAGNPGDLPDMWENYMDYSRDACQVMFTKDQIALVRSVLGMQRGALPTQIPTALPEAFLAKQKNVVYPNPASDVISVRAEGNIRHMAITNLLGRQLMKLDGAAAATRQYRINELPAGTYFLHIATDKGQSVERFVVAR